MLVDVLDFNTKMMIGVHVCKDSASTFIPHVCGVLLSPAAPEARYARYSNSPPPPSVLSVCPSVTFSFRTVTRKRIDIFSQNFAGTCTMSWGCAV